MSILYLFLGIIIGTVIGFFIANSRQNKIMADIISQRDVLRAQLENCQLQYQQNLANSEKRLQELREDQAQQLEQLQKQYREALEQQNKLVNEQIRTASEQIHNASEQILKQRAEELSVNNNKQLAEILNPLHENIKQMKEAVEKNDHDQSMSMERLDASIKANLKQAQEVGERADKLAQALTSENKTQGNFGELRLRQILESMGLEEGTQFEEQYTMKDVYGKPVKSTDNGQKLIPDVILHFPDGRDVIIDSKMSFKAFEDYYNAETDAQQQDALKRHITSIRTHVSELAKKQYSNYITDGHQKLDFVFMYVFSESALHLALTNDPSLWKWAYDQGVIISGSQNLYMMLRVLEMTWKQVRQVENQQRIMNAANLIIDRVQSFYERLKNVEILFNKTSEAFDKLNTLANNGGPSIETAASKLLKYGAQENPKRKYKLQSSKDSATAENLIDNEKDKDETEF